MFQFTDPGLQIEGWIKAQPSKVSRLTRRTLRQRKCNPPRLTTKTQNEKKKR